MNRNDLKKPISLEHSCLNWPLPDELLKKLAMHLPQINQYPSGGCYTKLSERLAQYTGVKKECILPTNGSDEVIETVTRAFGQNLILIPSPTFSQYEVSADRCGYPKKLIPSLHQGLYQLCYKKTDLQKASLVWICNPNNPTGNALSRDEIIRVLRLAKGKVVVDECNYEYLGETVIDLMESFPNLIISRSFSKNFGLAGLRLGYAMSNPENIKNVFRYCQNFRINKVSEMAGLEVLNHLDYFKRVWHELSSVREKFVTGVGSLGFAVFPSRTNFVLVDFKTTELTRRVWQYLKDRKVYTFPAWFEEFSGLAPHYIRFSIGQQAEMDYVLALLSEFRKGGPV